MDVDTQLEGSPKAPKPHDFLWFPDGNVVLATDTYLFKVHKSLLSVHSSVFKDMFELPDVGHDSSIPGGPGRSDAALASDSYKGVPMVTMVGDKGEDVAHLLRAVFDPNYYHRDDDDTPLEVVVALLLLSTKYDFNGVRKNVIRHLSRHYPMTLREYEAADRDEDVPLFGKSREDCDFSLLAAAVTAEADVLLPCLFFVCSNYSIDTTLDRMQSVPREALHILIRGRESLTTCINKFIVSLPSQLYEREPTIDCPRVSSRSCFANASCSESNLEDYIQTQFKTFTGAIIMGDCFGFICRECRYIAESMVDEKRKEIWDAIPTRYKFPEWGVLQDKLKALLESCNKSMDCDRHTSICSPLHPVSR
ncbi:hypothetical protein SCHPADRAFT_932249 [Schizopora paradoxa]|uniref:BTB domain-containing protein n=1 Tax=Schizopora paradoxa TaxID=27342 RepID=A0A0H2R7B5_9AGAM|nr:hypothetical protein SCHPADRAFT_932249 [Schizopora paradoxa]